MKAERFPVAPNRGINGPQLRTIHYASLPGAATTAGLRTPALTGVRFLPASAGWPTTAALKPGAFPIRARIRSEDGTQILADSFFIYDEGWLDFGGLKVQLELWSAAYEIPNRSRFVIQYAENPQARAPEPTKPRTRLLYASGDVPLGAIIQTGALRLDDVEELLIIVTNGDAAPRNLTEGIMLPQDMADPDPTWILAGTTLRAVAAGATELGTYGRAANATGSTFAIARTPPPWATYTLAAGAAGISTLTIFGR